MEPFRNGLEAIHLLAAIARDDPASRRHAHASCNSRARPSTDVETANGCREYLQMQAGNWALLMTKKSIRGTQRATCLRRRLSLSRKFFQTRLGHCRSSTERLPRFCALLQLFALCRLRIASSRPAAEFNGKAMMS